MAGNVHGGNDCFSGYPKGNGQSWSYDDQATFGVDLDFQKLVGWQGAKLHIFGKDLPGQWNFTIYGNTNNRETTGAAKSWLGSAPGVPPDGSLGDPDVDPRFLSPAMPRAYFGGVKISF